MTEQGAESSSTETEDVEGHRNLMAGIEGPDEDVEGHLEQRPPLVDGVAEEDVEGHVEPPRGDDTDHLHS
jgi:hypothetical protein